MSGRQHHLQRDDSLRHVLLSFVNDSHATTAKLREDLIAGDRECDGGLPAEERSVCKQVWYHGFTQLEAADVLNLSEAKVRRAWVSARLRLRDALQGEMPQM